MNRGLWFVAGAGLGVWAMTRARRVAEAFTPDGFRDRISGLVVGAQLMREEFTAGAAEAEADVRDRMGLVPTGPPQLTAAPEADDRPDTDDHDEKDPH